MIHLTVSQKAMIFRSLSATAYLCIFLASWHAAFTGFIHFIVGIPICLISVIMLFVQVTPLLGNSVNVITDKLEDLYFLQGENVFTFGGRCIIDSILVFILIFYMKKIVLGIYVLGLILSVIFLKDTEIELFHEVFGGSSGITFGAGVGGNGNQNNDQNGQGVPFGTGGYQTVIES